MGKIYILFFAMFLAGCGTAPGVFMEEATVAEHPEWQVKGDTIVRDFNLNVGMSHERNVPMRLTLLPVVDTLGVTHAGYIKLERLPGGVSGVRMEAGEYSLEGNYRGTEAEKIATLTVKGRAWALWAPLPVKFFRTIDIGPDGNLIKYD